MVKVPHCKGSYQARKSGDGWQIKYPLGWSEEKAKYDEYREEFGSEAEAIAALKDINDFIYHGGKRESIALHRGKTRAEAIDNAKPPTIEEFAKVFFKIRKDQGKVSERTLQSDIDCLTRVFPYIGSIPIDEVTPLEIDQMYAAMRAGDRRNKTPYKPYSGTTVQKTHCSLSLLFSKAVDYEFINRNPCEKVERPKRDTKEKVSLNAEQANDLHAFILAHGLEARPIGVLIALHTGVRLSEMLALNWEDYRDGCIIVSKSQHKDRQATKETKNGEARIVPCPLPLRKALEEWKSLQKAWFDEMGLEWSEDCPIVNSEVGNHVLQRSFGKWFSAAVKEYPVPEGFTFHGLRHTYASLMSVECMVADKTTQDLTGHKTYQAHAIYLHSQMQNLRDAAAKYGELFAQGEELENCSNCAHWGVSPGDGAIGACWVRSDAKSIPVTGCYSECECGAFEKRRSA